MPGAILKSKSDMIEAKVEVNGQYLIQMILQLSDGRAIMWLTLLLLEWVTLIRLNDGAKRIRPT